MSIVRFAASIPLFAALATPTLAADQPAPVPNGITLPQGY